MVAVGVSVAFGFLAAVLELLFPDQILPALFQLVGSTCLMVWGSALVSQLILRRRADRDGTALPLRMKGFPGLTIFGLVLLALIFAVGFSSPESSKQLVSTLVAGGRHRRGLLDRRPDHPQPQRRPPASDKPPTQELGRGSPGASRPPVQKCQAAPDARAACSVVQSGQVYLG